MPRIEELGDLYLQLNLTELDYQTKTSNVAVVHNSALSLFIIIFSIEFSKTIPDNLINATH